MLTTVLALMLAQAPTTRSLSAINVGFANQPTDTSAQTVAELRDYFFGVGNRSVNDYYKEVSYGQFAFTGDAFAVNLPIDNPSGPDCDSNCVLGAAQSHIYNSHPEMIAMFMALIGPWGSSYAQVGTPGSFTGGTAALNGAGQAIHELGHLMGNSHSGSYFCNPGPLAADPAQCTGWQYGPVSAMGAAGGHFHAGQKRQLGWLTTDDIAVTTSGVIVLAPFELPSALPRVLEVGPYLIENRQPIGFDRVAVGDGGLTFSVQRGLYSPGSGYTDWVFVKVKPDACVMNCDTVLPADATFHDPAFADTQLWVSVIATFEEASMVLVHTGAHAPLIVSNLAVAVGGDSAVVTWDTDVPSSSYVEYGARAVALDSESEIDEALVTQHSVTLSGLPYATELVFRAVSFADTTPGYAYGAIVTGAAPPTPVPPAETPPASPQAAPADAPPSELSASVTGCAAVDFDFSALVVLLLLVLSSRRRRDPSHPPA